MNFSPAILPFSSYGCWLSLFKHEENLVLQNVRRYRAKLFRFQERLSTGETVQFLKLDATPGEVTATGTKGIFRFTWENHQTLLIEAQGASLDLELHAEADGFGTVRRDHFRFYSNKTQSIINVTAFAGEAIPDFRSTPVGLACRQVTQSARLTFSPNDEGKIQVRITIADIEEEPKEGGFDFSASADCLNRQWEQFLALTPEGLREEQSQRAWYNLWSSTLLREGCFVDDGILMSKMHMTGIWSWDHCFNGLALGLADLKKGIEQVRLPFGLQAATGVLPDVWQVSHTRWIYSKPPVHGWTLAKLLPQDYPEEDLRWTYDRVAKITEWWLSQRDPDGSGFPVSIHPNDGGWDNATIFDHGQPMALPEIPAFLALQMEWLADAAKKLELEEAENWQNRSKNLIDLLVGTLWKDDEFCGRMPFSGELIHAPLCLETCMPIVLGKRLPQKIFSVLAKRIETHFVTPYGPATESRSSAKYLEDGYWRGPVWAPSTYLIVEGLRDGGNHALSNTLATSFCHAVEASGGFYENYSASDGRGLCDPGYTWTAAVYLLLKNSL